MLGNLIPWKKKKNGDVKVLQDPDYPVARLRQEFDALWDHFLNDWETGGLSMLDDFHWIGSRVDFQDGEKEYVVRAELPGFEPDDIDVKVSGSVLTVQAEHKENGKNGDSSFHRYGRFYESFSLPKGVLADQISARYRNGVLEVHLPKDEEFKGKRIAVKAS